MVHQPNCWSKRPGTWIEHVLAYFRDGKMYVGCIELLFQLYRATCRYYKKNKRPKGSHIVHLSTMCHLFDGLARAAILFFSIGPENTNLVEDVEILLPVKFRWIPFSDFRGEVENVSANQRPGPPSCFSDRPEKHKVGRGHWDLASCQVPLNSVQRFQRRSRKCLSQSEATVAILFFRSAQKTQTW